MTSEAVTCGHPCL